MGTMLTKWFRRCPCRCAASSCYRCVTGTSGYASLCQQHFVLVSNITWATACLPISMSLHHARHRNQRQHTVPFGGLQYCIHQLEATAESLHVLHCECGAHMLHCRMQMWQGQCVRTWLWWVPHTWSKVAGGTEIWVPKSASAASPRSAVY